MNHRKLNVWELRKDFSQWNNQPRTGELHSQLTTPLRAPFLHHSPSSMTFRKLVSREESGTENRQRKRGHEELGEWYHGWMIPFISRYKLSNSIWFGFCPAALGSCDNRNTFELRVRKSKLPFQCCFHQQYTLLQLQLRLPEEIFAQACGK